MTAQDAIAEANKAFQAAFHKGDTEAISRMYTEDAELFIPEVPVVRGRKAIADAWRQVVGTGGNTVTLELREVQEFGQWAYEVGRFNGSAPDGSFLMGGKYIVIWKRDSAGEWKLHRDIFNADPPPSEQKS